MKDFFYGEEADFDSVWFFSQIEHQILADGFTVYFCETPAVWTHTAVS